MPAKLIMVRIAALTLFGFLVFPGTVFSSDNLELHGFLLGIYTGRTTGRGGGKAQPADIMLSEERIRTDIETWSKSVEASARIKVDIVHDSGLSTFSLDLREAYTDYSTGPLDFALGRQIVTWGVGDLVFINDVFPKDWESFFLGRPLDYLKTGIDGLRTRISTGVASFDLLVIPVFTPDILPGGDRFFMFDPLAGITDRNQKPPSQTYENVETAARAYGRLLGLDVSAYFYRGFWHSPGFSLDDTQNPTHVEIFYPALSTAGFSAQGRAPGGIISIEGGYYYSRKDKHGDSPMIPNSQSRFLVGYQRQLREDLHLGAQYYYERMEDYSAYVNSLPSGMPAQKEYRDMITMRLTRFMKHQTVKLSFFGFYSPNDRDYLVQPVLSYNIADNFKAAVGGNLFGGAEDTTFLGQFDKNDNAYLSLVFDY